MAVAQKPFLAAVLLLISSGLQCSSSLPGCPEPCTCQSASLLNCSSSGLSLVPQHIQDSVTELDLSDNLLGSVTLDRPHHNLRNVWLGNNSITHLNLCLERNLGGRWSRGRRLQGFRPRSKQRCVSWARTLQLLSVERNLLEQLPEGLEGCESLQFLQLSFNRISTLQPGDLSHLRQLTELHLQHNLITSLHPQMFQDLEQLQVLDLSFNKLTSLHPSMYFSLRNIEVDVRLGGNRWQCDCSMRSLRRRMAYDSSRGLQTWTVVCGSPSIISGKDLLQLEEDDLNCFNTEDRPELYQDLTVFSGSKILLSCSTQDSTWWTPSGDASVSPPQAGLLINDITERDTGLYVCVSQEQEVVSVFNLQINKIRGARRNTRSLPRISRQVIPQSHQHRIGQERNQRATQSDLTLAICLSVFITFLIAFILGVLARPCIDVLCRRVTKKKRSSEISSSVEQRQYDNEAYSTAEEPEAVGTQRERRVKFNAELRENSNVQYYDTIVSGDQESINNEVVIECETAKSGKDTHTAGDSGSENGLRPSGPEENQEDGRAITDAGRTHNTEFEHIPDPDERKERGSLSSCSDSSLSDKVSIEDQMTKRDHSTPTSAQLAEDSVQQRADFSTSRKVTVPQMSVEGSEIPGFSSEPFADWSPHAKNPKLTDPDLWQESEEQFEFSDSVQSMSGRSSSIHDSFNDTKLIVAPTLHKQKRDDTSSSSSDVSCDEPTEYTVNSNQEDGEEEDIERTHNKEQIHGKGDSTCDTQRHAVRPQYNSDSSDIDMEDHTVTQKTVKDVNDESVANGERETRKKVVPMPRRKWRVAGLVVTSHGKSTGASLPPAAYSSSSSSESEGENKDPKVKQNTGRLNKGIKINEPEALSTDLDHQYNTQIKSCLDINTPVSAYYSTSSDESADETTKHTQKQVQGQTDMARLPIKEDQSASNEAMTTKWPSLDLDHVAPIKRGLDVRAQSPIDSSSSSSSADETIDKKQMQESQTVSSDNKWPTPDLEHILYTKSCVDAKAPTLASVSSSSSESGDEIPHHTTLNLEQTDHFKRRLDINAPSPNSGSLSSSEDETTSHIEKQTSVKVDITGLPNEESQTENHDQDTQWPVLDLELTTRIKRHLDIKAPQLASDSSSSSDSEDEPTNHIKKQEKQGTYITGFPIKVSQTISHDDQQTQWPVLDLEHVPHVKRRLDIKATSPDSDSSQAGSRDPYTKGPVLDHTRLIKRSPEIKPLSPASDSSSSSDSEDEPTNHIKKQEKQGTYITGFPIKVSQTISHDDQQTQWPVLDLEHVPRVKRRLDIKATSPDSDSSQAGSRDPYTKGPVLDHTRPIKRSPDIKPLSPASDSSSSSDSEDEPTNHIKKQEKQGTYITGFPIKVSQTISHDDQQTQWPVLDLEHVPRVKRRLDIKATSPDSDSSQAGSRDPYTKGPVLDHTRPIKRSPDIKPLSLASDSSSSSDSEDEPTNHIKKQEKQGTYVTGFPIKVSQTISHDDQQTQWPVLDLERVPRVKRRLDIKATSPDSDSSQAGSRDPYTKGPVLDHTRPIKRSPDIKPPSSASDSSSSSDSEDETTNHVRKQEKEGTYTTGHPKWPLLDLEHAPRVKRHLDIKAPSPDSDSSSSSGGEDETTNRVTKQQEGTYMTGLPIKVSQTISPQTKWPALDLELAPRIKRRLDIKAPSLASDSSSSSDSEDERMHLTNKERPELVGVAGLPFKKSPTVHHDPVTQWPTLDFGNISRIKRRLDIKAPSPPPDSILTCGSMIHVAEGQRVEDIKISHCYSSSSSDEQEDGFEDLGNLRTTVEPDENSRWPQIDLSSTSNVKRRLDIRARSTQPDPDISGLSPGQQSESNSSRSDREDEDKDYAKRGVGVSKATDMELSSSPKTLVIHHSRSPKTDQNIKLQKYTALTDNAEDNMTRENRSRTPELESRWATMNLGISRFRKRLEITPHSHELPNLSSSPPPDSPSASSSDTGSYGSRTRRKRREVGMEGIIHTESSLTPEKTHNVSLSLKGQDDNSGEVRERLVRYQDMSQRVTAPPLLKQMSDSSSSSESEDASTEREGIGWRGKSQLAAVTDETASQTQTSLYVDKARDIKLDKSQNQTEEVKKGEAGVELKSQTSEVGDQPKSVQPPFRRALDIRGRSEKEVSSSSNSEDEIDHSVLDLSLGIPRVKRRLNVKAPLPGPSNSPSSCSENENEVTGYTAKQSKYAPEMTDNDSLITYKRLIFSASSPQSNSFSRSHPTVDLTNRGHTGAEIATVAQEGPSHNVEGRNASLAPVTVPNMRFDDVLKRIDQFRSNKYADLPSEIRWTGVGHQLSDLSISSSQRHLDGRISNSQQPPPVEPQHSTHKYSSTSRAHLLSSRARDEFDNSASETKEILGAVPEERSERKGLGGLKASSSERRKWDTQARNLDKVASPLLDDYNLQVKTGFNYQRSGKDITPLAKQPLSVDDSRATDLFGIPRYRRHDVESTDPPEEAPPPIPGTPPSDEVVGLPWRSLQSKQGSVSRKTEEADPSSQNISYV